MNMKSDLRGKCISQIVCLQTFKERDRREQRKQTWSVSPHLSHFPLTEECSHVN